MHINLVTANFFILSLWRCVIFTKIQTFMDKKDTQILKDKTDIKITETF